MRLRLELADANHPNLVSLSYGPTVLFALADSQPAFTKSSLLTAKPMNNAMGDWLANSSEGTPVVMRLFMNIDKENYSTYVLLKS